MRSFFFVGFLTGVYCPCCQFGLQRTDGVVMCIFWLQYFKVIVHFFFFLALFISSFPLFRPSVVEIWTYCFVISFCGSFNRFSFPSLLENVFLLLVKKYSLLECLNSLIFMVVFERFPYMLFIFFLGFRKTRFISIFVGKCLAQSNHADSCKNIVVSLLCNPEEKQFGVKINCWDFFLWKAARNSTCHLLSCFE